MEIPTGKHYMVSALKRKHLDRIPVTALTGPYCSRLTKHTVKDILTNAGKSADAHLAFFNRFQPDSLIVYNDIYLEAETLGCKLEFPEDNISHIKLPVLEDKAQLAKLKVPDPGKDGRFPLFFELCERVFSEVRNDATMGLGHSGPWNLAMHLRGAQNLLIEVKTDPEFVHNLMTFTTEVVQVVGDALIRAGFSPSIGEASASCSLISPQIYQDFIKPYHKKLYDYFASQKSYMSLHVCGYIDPIVKDIIDTGINFISLDAPSSLSGFLRSAKEKVVIMGNVSTSLFATGTKDEMEKAIAKCIETAAGSGGYILSSGCEIPLNASDEKIDHFFTYGRNYGKDFISKLP